MPREPFNPALAGRNPDQTHVFDVIFKHGKRTVGSGRMAGLPPIGYVYVETDTPQRGNSGFQGERYRVTGGELLEPSKSKTSTLCVTQAVVFVEPL